MADDARPEDESLHDALDALARAMHDALELDTTPQARAANVAGKSRELRTKAEALAARLGPCDDRMGAADVANEEARRELLAAFDELAAVRHAVENVLKQVCKDGEEVRRENVADSEVRKILSEVASGTMRTE
mmetsp:Transcript_16011/g.49546  ORF Transcript_16011/g.49546 Transcript_16011/m.49546 type:complete len:133 (+) Transcript_16011:432-830(+)